MIRRRYLEFDAAAHCTLRCALCSHMSPYLKPEVADVDSFAKDVRALAKVMRVRRFRFVGGEPLLNEELERMVAILRESRLARRIGVCTNGQLASKKMTPRMMDMLNVVDVSIYPGSGVDDHEVRDFLEPAAKRHRFRLNLKPKHEFMVVNLEEPIAERERVQQIYDDCEIAHSWGCHIFKNGFYYKCCKPLYQDEFMQAKGQSVDFSFAGVDGIAIHEPALKRRLRTYLRSPEPLESCRWCLGTQGPKTQQRQLSREEVSNWAL